MLGSAAGCRLPLRQRRGQGWSWRVSGQRQGREAWELARGLQGACEASVPLHWLLPACGSCGGSSWGSGRGRCGPGDRLGLEEGPGALGARPGGRGHGTGRQRDGPRGLQLLGMDFGRGAHVQPMLLPAAGRHPGYPGAAAAVGLHPAPSGQAGAHVPTAEVLPGPFPAICARAAASLPHGPGTSYPPSCSNPSEPPPCRWRRAAPISSRMPHPPPRLGSSPSAHHLSPELPKTGAKTRLFRPLRLP